MLPVRLLRRRISPPTCLDVRLYSATCVRCSAPRDIGAGNGADGGKWSDDTAGHQRQEEAVKDGSGREESGMKKLSLMEQLFPEECKRYDAVQKAAKDVPRLPFDRGVVRPVEVQSPISKPIPEQAPWDYAKRRESPREAEARKAVLQEMGQEGSHTSILFLQTASPNLTEGDFRRLSPQGKHVEGWTLEDDDILQIIPVRDLANLKQTGSYYLLFRSQIAAFNYQAYVERVKRIASWQTPRHATSPMSPPKGYLIEGLDAHDALQAFTLVPARQEFKLRRLRFPLAPYIWSLVKYGGYASLVNRPDRMPFELRMTFDGPQLQIPAILDTFAASSVDRAVNWGGPNRRVPKITKWEPRRNVNHTSTNDHAVAHAKRANRADSAEQNDTSKPPAEDRRRTPSFVYILGFETERHMDSFRLFWHRKPMTFMSSKYQRTEDVEEDIPPIVNLEVLW